MMLFMVQLGDEKCLEIITSPRGLGQGLGEAGREKTATLGWECRGDRVNNSREGATPGPCRM